MLKVLIIDDEQNVCNFLCEALSEIGCRSFVSLNGEEAIAQLNAQAFDVILIDIMLPGGMSGMDLLRKIRAQYPGTPCVMATAINDLDTAAEAIGIGAAAYLVKPLVIDKLSATFRGCSLLANRVS